MSPGLLTWCEWIAHWAGLLPLCAWLFTRSGTAAGWISLAFAVSWVADTAALIVNPTLVSRLFPFLQFGLCYLALDTRPRAVLWMAIAWAAMGAGVGSQASVDAFGPGVASVLLLLTPGARGRWSGPLLLYFGLGTAAWVGVVWTRTLTPWLLYQTCRVVGLCWFALVVWDERKRLVSI